MWKLLQAKRTPNGVFVEIELEDVGNRGWLRLYLDPDAAEVFNFSSTYELNIKEVKDAEHD